MCASLCDSFTISAYDFRLHLSPTAQFGILQFHLYRRNDFTLSRLPMLRFHPRLRFWPAIGLTMSTRYFDVRFRRAKTCINMRFWPAMGPAICAAGLPLAFAADSSILNQWVGRPAWASIPACDDYGTGDSRSLQFRSPWYGKYRQPAILFAVGVRSSFRQFTDIVYLELTWSTYLADSITGCCQLIASTMFALHRFQAAALGLTACHSIPLRSSHSPFCGTTIAAPKASASLRLRNT
jgi:hypothetical protein